MKGLSNEIENALKTILDGLDYDFFPNDEFMTLDAEKMKVITDSKISSFNSAKKILDKWMNSPNAPSDKVIRKYIQKLITRGLSAIEILRKALSSDIDFDKLEAHKHNAAIKAKPIILEAIFDLDTYIIELKQKLESDDLRLAEKDFKLGYAERFASGEFYPLENYFKEWYDKENDAVKICPHSTKGEMITLDNLNIYLPEVPINKKEILFSNLPIEEQYWKRLPVPKGITPDNVDMFSDYIKEEFRRRREGIWFMNNGIPVYLTGHHYFALQHGKMLDTGGYMNFRYAQAKIFYHLQAVLIDSRCLGELFVKSRRTGFTYIVLMIMLNESTSTRNNNFGITSKSDDDAKKAFLKYRYALLNLPFYFTPVIKGKLDSPKEFEFASPLDNSKDSKRKQITYTDDYLNNLIDFQPTKDDSYDGQKLFRYLWDEVGKIKPPTDAIKHYGQVSPTMMEGGEIVGKTLAGSTVGAAKKGGSNFKMLYDSSDVRRRDPITNMTVTGLYSYFLAAQDNMTAFTDKYGVCHVETPKEIVYNTKGNIIEIGSTEFLINQENAKKKQSDKELNEQYRAFPRTIEHAFRDESSDTVFNITKIYEQIDHNNLTEEHERYTIGNFEWKDGVIDDDVIFYPNPKGRFKIAWMPSVADETEGLQNRVKNINGKFYPLNKEIIRFGCDPFSLKSTHGEGSKGGIHGKTLTFPEGGAPSNIFAVEYIARPSDETIFFEDVIKCIRFYGAPILVESNRIDLLRHMRNRGYRGFSMNRLDRPFNKLNDNEKEYGGQPMSGKDMLDSHMNSIGSWIEKYVGVNIDESIRTVGEVGIMPFNETLKDWLKFDPSDRTKYDATISSGLAIMACQSEKYRGKAPDKPKPTLQGILKKYSNSGNISQLTQYEIQG